MSDKTGRTPDQQEIEEAHRILHLSEQARHQERIEANNARFMRAKDERDNKKRALREMHADPGLPETLTDKLFNYAYEQGHASGWHEVESTYREVLEIVDHAYAAGLGRGRRGERGALRWTVALLLVAVMSFLMAFGSVSKADAAASGPERNPLPAWVWAKDWKGCEYEDSRNCVWNGQRDGNGVGSSFLVTRANRVIPLNHWQAWRLTRHTR